MSDVHTTLVILRNKLHEMTGLPVYILDAEPAAMDKQTIYIIAPRHNSVSRRPLISTSSMLEYHITIFQIVHIQDVSRQRNIQDNVVAAYNTIENCILGECFNRINNERRIGTANIYSTGYGTSSWVVNSTIYTAYELSLHIRDIVDD